MSNTALQCSVKKYVATSHPCQIYIIFKDVMEISLTMLVLQLCLCGICAMNKNKNLMSEFWFHILTFAR